MRFRHPEGAGGQLSRQYEPCLDGKEFETLYRTDPSGHEPPGHGPSLSQGGAAMEKSIVYQMKCTPLNRYRG